MIRSMTAFGRAKREGEDKDITIEIKSVNSRFFDCSVKMPRAYSFLEERIKAYVGQNAVSRAKVDVYVTVDEHTSGIGSVRIDEALAESYIAALRTLSEKFDLPCDITTMKVASNRDIFTYERPEEDLEGEWERFREVLDEALSRFIDGRAREGANIEADLRAKVKAISTMVDRIEELSLSDIGSYREKLEAKLREVLSDNNVTFDENRILTECAIFADRIAIDEELVRLRSHFDGFEDILRSEEPVGRKLDFLVQEINRETNTIGSKCQNSSIARLVVDIKCEIEKIREQIQNIE